MLKKYYNSSDERLLKEQSTVMFKEVSSGVYHVAKDRKDQYDSYANSEQVIFALNNEEKVYVSGSKGIYANFELIRK